MRAAYLQGETADDQVRREVLSLLAHDGLAQAFFDDALQSAAASARVDSDLPRGARIGSYTIQGLLGRGGMGVVYLGVRADGAFEQRVAIKVIPSSGPGSLLRERFQQQRQILAGLSHPTIARLFHGGESPAGQASSILE